MEIHHGKHHQAYVDNANKALEGTEWADRPVEELLADLDALPEDNRTAVRNNAGGHANHSLFWKTMGPNGGGEPSGALERGDREPRRPRLAQEQVNDAGVKRFGSGWTWVVADGGSLSVLSTPNQDSPLMEAEHTAPRHRRLGARLLPQLPEPSPRLPRRVVERRQLGRGGEAVRAGTLSRTGAVRALVTGGTGKLGTGIVATLEAEGWHVLAAGSRDGDLADAAAARALVERAAAELGGLDVVVNAAAAGFVAKPFEEVTEADVDAAIDVTVKGSFFVTQAAAAHLRERNGLVVMVEDVAAYQPWPSFAAHCAAKAAQAMLTRVLARALAPEVRVCGVAPGPVAVGPDEIDAARRRDAPRPGRHPRRHRRRDRVSLAGRVRHRRLARRRRRAEPAIRKGSGCVIRVHGGGAEPRPPCLACGAPSRQHQRRDEP